MKKLLLFIISVSMMSLPYSGCSGSSGGSGSTGDSSGDTTDEPAITATTTTNPNNVLSVYVNWTTESPMDSEVRFGVNGYQYRIHDNTEVTNHHLLVIGMHAETTYHIRAISSGSDST